VDIELVEPETNAFVEGTPWEETRSEFACEITVVRGVEEPCKFTDIQFHGFEVRLVEDIGGVRSCSLTSVGKIHSLFLRD
jgi:hypothetical protein